MCEREKSLIKKKKGVKYSMEINRWVGKQTDRHRQTSLLVEEHQAAKGLESL